MSRVAAPAAAGVLLALSQPGAPPAEPTLPPPAPQVPPAFKESADWKAGQPADELKRGAWWEIFGDPQLNGLETTIDVSNDTLRGAQARFLQARAAVGIARASRYPQVTTSPQITTGTQSGNRTNATQHERVTDFLLPVDVSYEADVWGRVRLGVASALASAQASAADVEAVRLSLHAELALDYFELRGLDAERVILEDSVAAFQRALDLTRNRFAGGVASQADVSLAETQLESTRAQAVDLGARRAALEHAIAVLTGKPPSALQLPSSPLATPPPDIPMGLPSDLLERRPDIAAAERRVAAAGAEVGIAQTRVLSAAVPDRDGGAREPLASELAERTEHVLVGRPRGRGDAGRRRAPSRRVGAGARGLRRDGRLLPGDHPAIAAGGRGQSRHAARAPRRSRHPGGRGGGGRAIGDARHQPLPRRRHQLSRSDRRAERWRSRINAPPSRSSRGGSWPASSSSRRSAAAGRWRRCP